MTNPTDKNSNEPSSRAEAQSKIDEQAPVNTNKNDPQTPQTQEEFFGLAIYTYTRKQALADGVQVDVSTLAREAGFGIPVFLTATVHKEYVQVPEGVTCQDETGRLWDILWMLRCAIGKKALRRPADYLRALCPQLRCRGRQTHIPPGRN